MRKDQAQIDMSMIQEAMDKRRLGLPNPSLPPSDAKTHMATVQVRPFTRAPTTTCQISALAICPPCFVLPAILAQNAPKPIYHAVCGSPQSKFRRVEDVGMLGHARCL